MKRSIFVLLLPLLLSACSVIPLEEQLPLNVQRRLVQIKEQEKQQQESQKKKQTPKQAVAPMLVKDVSKEDAKPKDTFVSFQRICILPPKGEGNDPVSQAMLRGAKHRAKTVTMLKQGDGPQACPAVLSWKAQTQGTRVNAIMVVPFTHGVPGRSVRIVPPQQQNGLTTQIVELNTAGYVRYLQRHALERLNAHTRKTR